MDLDYINTFIQVANLENYTQAAKVLNYAQSTITFQIQQLEKELGFPLFERIGRKNYLTPGGQEFLSYASEILHAINKAGTIGQNLEDITGSLRVGVLESLLFAGILPILPDFRREFPKIDVFLRIGGASDLVSLLKQNQLDIIYISNIINMDSAVKCCYCRKEEIIFAADPRHPLAKEKKIPLPELMCQPFIVAERTGRCYSRLCEIAAEHELSFHYSILVDNLAAISTLLHDGQSVTFLPAYALTRELQMGELVKLDIDLPPQFYYSQLLYHKNKWRSPFMDGFIKHIHQYRPEDSAQSADSK